MAVFMCLFIYFFFFKQKTAYEMRIIDWSSDVCSSDLLTAFCGFRPQIARLLALARKSAISRRGERHSRPDGRDMRDDEFEPRLGWRDRRGQAARYLKKVVKAAKRAGMNTGKRGSFARRRIGPGRRVGRGRRTAAR